MSRILPALFCTGIALIPIFGEHPSDVIRPANGPAYSQGAYETGRRDAERDVRENRLIVEMSGMPKPWDGEWARLLREKFHIQLKQRGCVIDDQTAGHERGYNEVSLAEIRRRHGPDVFRDTQAEAERQWKAKRNR